MLSSKWLRGYDIPVCIGIGIVHIMALVAPWYFTWSGFGLFLFLFWVTGGLGITLCFHRLLTHRSFKTPKWFEYFLSLCGTLAFQGGLLTWVGTHRLHHAYSDQEGDPHSPVTHDFSWAHVTWLLKKHNHDFLSVTKDLQEDPVLVVIDRFFWVPQVVVTVALFTIGFLVEGLNLGISWVLWGIGMRTVFGYHAAWFVNSAAHTWGYRNYKTKDDSRNNWWVAIISFGEGWHNNHHGDQVCAAHGNRHWWEIDPTYITIQFLALVGLATNVKKPKPIPPAKAM